MRQLLQRHFAITTRALGVIVVAGIACFASTAAAGANDTLYWTAGSPSTALVSANLDGTGSTTTMTVGVNAKTGVAIDLAAGKIYWAEGWSGRINWTWLNSSANVYTLFTGQDYASAVAIDPANGKLYWTIDRDQGNGEIRSGNLSGTGIPASLFTGLNSPTGLAIDPPSGTMYWTEYGGGTVDAGNLDGNYSPRTLYSGEVEPVTVAVDDASGKVFWTTAGASGKIRSGTVDGSSSASATTLYNGEDWPVGIALDPSTSSIYWATADGKAIRVGTFTGSVAAQNRITGQYAADYLALARAPVGRSVPTISGTARIGQALTCSRGGWMSDQFGALLYRVPAAYGTGWARNGAVVGSGTTYTPSAAGSYTCSVTAYNQAGFTTQTSAATAVPAPPTATITAPANHQTYRVGESVATGFSCAKGTLGGNVTSCVDSNATAAPVGHINTSTPGAHTYTVTATSTDGLTGTASISYTVAAPPSVAISAPANHQTYTSEAQVSTTFSCTEGTGGPGLDDCVDSNGDDPPEGFIDTSVIGAGTYTVTATSLDGQTASASISYTVTDETPPPARGAPVNTALPTISGRPTVGARLTASSGTWSGAQPIILHYLWQRCSASCVDIGGATASTYTVAAADVGAKIRVQVFASNKAGRTSATAEAVGPVSRGGTTGPTAAQIRAALLKELAPYGRAAKLGTVLRTHGYAYDCTALIRGVMTISWYQVPKGAHLSKAPKPVLIATGRRTFTAAGHGHMIVKLTKAGTRLLSRNRQVKLSAKATFARAGLAQVSAIKAITLKR